MLEINSITKKYGNLTALEDINLSIKSGEFYGILGPNGAGKTTLMNIIIGFLLPDSGKASFNGGMISSHDLEIRKKLGYVPQDISLYLELSAEKNLKIFGELYGISSNILKQRMSKVLDLVQLNERRKDKVKNFSGGMKRRLNLAVSLLHKPELLLCDEPTVGVDPQSRNGIFEMLQQINAEGTTIIYTTHYMEEAERLCSKIAIIDHGSIVAEGSLHELIALLKQKDTIKIKKTIEAGNIIEKLKEYGKVIEQDFHYELILNDANELNADFLKKLEDKGISLSQLEISGASLEDVFLTLTGRSLRD